MRVHSGLLLLRAGGRGHICRLSAGRGKAAQTGGEGAVVLTLSFLLLLIGAPVWAFEDPAQHLGADLDSVFDTFGRPEAVYSSRGPSPVFDDVVFEYENSMSVFWYHNRVWMLRFSPGFAGSVYGVALGENRQEVTDTLGRPDFAQGESLFYDLPFRGFPVRLRLVLEQDSVSDLYLYRSDF